MSRQTFCRRQAGSDREDSSSREGDRKLSGMQAKTDHGDSQKARQTGRDKWTAT
jgi:hypothetical protein